MLISNSTLWWILALCIIYLIIVFACQYAFFYYKSRVFFRWAKRQKLVLVAGGPSSGKKLLLTFLGHKLRNSSSEAKIYHLLTLYADNKVYDINGKSIANTYSGYIDSKERVESTFLLNELADKQSVRRVNVSPLAGDEHDIVAEIYRSNYYGKKIWIAFSEKKGYLWERLSGRNNATVTCERVGSFRFLFKKFYFLKLHSTFNGVSTVRFALLNGSILSKYENHWLKRFYNASPLLSRK